MDTNLDIQIEEALKAYLTSGVEDQVDYQKFYLYSIVTHSTAIEGSTVTKIENQLLFDKGIAAILITMCAYVISRSITDLEINGL